MLMNRIKHGYEIFCIQLVDSLVLTKLLFLNDKVETLVSV